MASVPGEARTHLDETTVWSFALLTLALLIAGIYFNLPTVSVMERDLPAEPRLESNESPRTLTV